MELAKKIIRVVIMSLVGFFVVVGCSKSKVRIFKKHGAPQGELKRIYDAVKVMSNGKLGNTGTTVGFQEHDEMNPDPDSELLTIGSCYMGLNEISINKRMWGSMTIEKQFILMAHEMYHCDCKKNHNEKKLADGCPSYLGAKIMNRKCLEDNMREYMNEIQKGCDL